MTLRNLALGLMVLTLGACAANPTARDDALIGLTVQYATAKYIEHKPSSRKEIVAVAQAVREVVSGDATATLVTLQEVVNGELDKLSLSPADRVLANALVQLVVAELQVKVGDGLLKEDQKIRVVSILDQIIATARA